MKVALNDVALLESLERKTQVIRDRVRGVVLGYQTAAYLVGRPGVGKTHAVKEELEKCDVPFLVKNSRISPMGLFRVTPNMSLSLMTSARFSKASRHFKS